MSTSTSTSTSKLYLVAGPAADRERANAFAARLDPQGGTLTFGAPFLHVVGADAQSPTHTGCFGPIADTHAPLVAAAMAAQFPGWQIIQCDDTQAALAQAALARVALAMP